MVKDEFTSPDGTLLGGLSESLVASASSVRTQASPARLGQLHTHAVEHEIDLIVERADRRVSPSRSSSPTASVMTTFATCCGCGTNSATDSRLDGRDHRPDTYRRADGVDVVPAALLGPSQFDNLPIGRSYRGRWAEHSFEPTSALRGMNRLFRRSELGVPSAGFEPAHTAPEADARTRSTTS